MEFNLQHFWDSHVPKGHKHFTDVMPEEKKKLLVKRFQDHVVDQLASQDAKHTIKTTLDWGCGGGLIAKIIAEFSEIILLDISQESLQKTTDYIAPIVPNDSILYDGTAVTANVDMIVCYSVIHHLVDLKTWHKIVANWKTIKPKFLAIQTKIGGLTKQNPDYRMNYTDSLILSKKDFIGPFENDYHLDYWAEEPHKKPTIKLGFALLRRKHT